MTRTIMFAAAPTLEQLADWDWRPSELIAIEHPPPKAIESQPVRVKAEPISQPHSTNSSESQRNGSVTQDWESYAQQQSYLGGSCQQSYLDAPPSTPAPLLCFKNHEITELDQLEARLEAPRRDARAPVRVQLVGFVTDKTPFKVVNTSRGASCLCIFTLCGAGAGSLTIKIWGDSARDFSNSVRNLDVVYLRGVDLERDHYLATGADLGGPKPMVGTLHIPRDLGKVPKDQAPVQLCYRIERRNAADDAFRQPLTAATWNPPHPETLRIKRIVDLIERRD